MTLLASLSGHRVVRARVSIPAWGAWFADVVVDGEVTLSGAASLVVADATFKGSVLSGGAAKGRSSFRLVGGAGGWAKTIPSKHYANDAGVKLSTVLGDAAAAVEETLDASTVPATRVGPAWTRPEDPAARVLELVSPGAWYVGEDGVTRLGRRPRTTYAGKGTLGPVDRGRAKVTVAADSIAGITPGVVVAELEAVDVEHSISAEGGLRSTVWGALSSTTTRQAAALQALLEQLDPGRRFRGVWEYRVIEQAGSRHTLQPVRVSTGMPSLQRVPVRPGIAGARARVEPGSRVLVAFIDEDPARPYVCGFEDEDGNGFAPITVSLNAESFVQLGAGIKPVIVAGDMAGIFPCVPTQPKVLA